MGKCTHRHHTGKNRSTCLPHSSTCMHLLTCAATEKHVHTHTHTHTHRHKWSWNVQHQDTRHVESSAKAKTCVYTWRHIDIHRETCTPSCASTRCLHVYTCKYTLACIHRLTLINPRWAERNRLHTGRGFSPPGFVLRAKAFHLQIPPRIFQWIPQTQQNSSALLGPWGQSWPWI